MTAQSVEQARAARERALLGAVHNGWYRASPAHGFRITILTGLLDSENPSGADFPRTKMKGSTGGTVGPIRYRQETLDLAA